MPCSVLPSDLAVRLEFAAEAVRAAGERLLHLRASGKWHDEMLGDIGDQAADGFLQGLIRGRFPGEAILSEETSDNAARLGAQWTWIVDPLDGTKEYRTLRHDWAVHVGLARQGKVVLGAVALPAIERTLLGCCASGSAGIELRGTAGDWPTAVTLGSSGNDAPLRLAVSRSHTPDWIKQFAERLGVRELVPSGSVGAKVGLLLLGKADAYVHRPGLKEWDTCAPEAVARAAGWVVCRLDGSEQRYNQPNPRNDEIVVCRPAHREAVLAALAQR